MNLGAFVPLGPVPTGPRARFRRGLGCAAIKNDYRQLAFSHPTRAAASGPPQPVARSTRPQANVASAGTPRAAEAGRAASTATAHRSLQSGTALNTARSSYSRCGPSSRHSSTYGNTQQPLVIRHVAWIARFCAIQPCCTPAVCTAKCLLRYKVKYKL